MNKKDLDIAKKADIMHRAASLYISSNIPRDYGTGDKYTASEVHFLQYIVNNPGITVTELSYDWDISRAASSMMTNKLERKGLIDSKPDETNKRKKKYFATENGKELNNAHLKYDSIVFKKTLDYMRETCSDENIEIMFQTLTSFINSLRKKRYRSK